MKKLINILMFVAIFASCEKEEIKESEPVKESTEITGQFEDFLRLRDGARMSGKGNGTIAAQDYTGWYCHFFEGTEIGDVIYNMYESGDTMWFADVRAEIRSR